MDRSLILERLILAGGPARGGTTMLAKILNSHPGIVGAIDNGAFESWGLYYYGSRVGLVHQLRTRRMSPKEAQRFLMGHVTRGDSLWGVAPSAKVATYPLVPPPVRPDSIRIAGEQIIGDRSLVSKAKLAARRFAQRLSSTQQPSATHQGLRRHRIPVELLRNELCLCLKSPEIAFVLPELANSFPTARFVLVYRPVIEIAESMYRKGFEWQLRPTYHRRWAQEFDEDGTVAATPGVPREWHAPWKAASDFQRCVIYAASYLRAMALGIPRIASSRVFVYSHAKLREAPSAVLPHLGEFLGVDVAGFGNALGTIRADAPTITADLDIEFDEIESQIGIQDWMARLRTLRTA